MHHADVDLLQEQKAFVTVRSKENVIVILLVNAQLKFVELT